MKYLFILILITFISPAVYADSVVYTEGWQPTRTHFCNIYPLDTQVTGLQNFCSDKGAQIIIGHSMGGVRALGYARNMKNNSGNIKGVIALDTEIQGVPCILGGTGYVQGRVNSAINTLSSAISSILYAGIGGIVMGPFASLNSQNTIASAMAAAIIGQITPSDFGFIETGNLSPGLNDMRPDSAFINSFLPGYSVVQSELGHWAWMQIGIRTNYYTVPYQSAPVMTIVPVYQYLYVIDRSAVVTTNYAINPNTPIAFIAGRNNDTITYATYETSASGVDNSSVNNNLNSANYTFLQYISSILVKTDQRQNGNNSAANIKNNFNALSTAFSIASVVEAVYGYSTFNTCLIAGSSYCSSASAICADPNGWFGDTIMSRDNDGFVPYYAQSSPLDASGHYQIGGKPIDPRYPVFGAHDVDGGYEAKKYNHSYVRSAADDVDKQVWGPDGVIYKLLHSLQVDNYNLRSYCPAN